MTTAWGSRGQQCAPPVMEARCAFGGHYSDDHRWGLSRGGVNFSDSPVSAYFIRTTAGMERRPGLWVDQLLRSQAGTALLGLCPASGEAAASEDGHWCAVSKTQPGCGSAVSWGAGVCQEATCAALWHENIARKVRGR